MVDKIFFSFLLLAVMPGCGWFNSVSEEDLQGAWKLTKERWEGALIDARSERVYIFQEGQIALKNSDRTTAYRLSYRPRGTMLTVQSPRTIELLDPIYDDQAMTFYVTIDGNSMTWHMGFLPMEMYVFKREEPAV